MDYPRPILLTEDEWSLDHVLDDDSIFTEAVFVKGKQHIKQLEPLIAAVQNKMKEMMSKGGKFNLQKFWKDTTWRDLEHKLQEVFGFKTIIFDLIDDGATSGKGNKIKLPQFNVWIQSLVRYPIEALVTDDGFYDKSKSLEAFVSVSTWFVKNLSPQEFLAVFLHEMGHGIDPAIVDITYTQTNMISEYLMDRKIPKKKETEAFIKKTKPQGLVGAILLGVLGIALYIFIYVMVITILFKAAFTDAYSPRKKSKGLEGEKGEKKSIGFSANNNIFANTWERVKRLFMGKKNYNQAVVKKYEQVVEKIVKNQKEQFNKYNYSEAFADNFARMYGYGGDLVSALKKMRSVVVTQRYRSRYKQDIERRKYIVDMIYGMTMDEHKTDIQRAQALLREYDADLNNPKIPPKVKKSIKEDRDNLAVVINEYLNNFDAFHNRMNKKIFETLNAMDVSAAKNEDSKSPKGKKGTNKEMKK
ncbi:MAG: hypothetical protein HDQ88_06600 [Clostridia bacterium]|nr:hypothetical protein [Clostridia bacterium]